MTTIRTIAALSSIIPGLGFGIPCAFGLRHVARTGEVWIWLGFPTYGGGPFEKWGLPTSVALLACFLVVCLAEVAVGVMIWADAPGYTIAAFVLLPFEMVFWIGFALPFGPPFGIARTVLVLLMR